MGDNAVMQRARAHWRIAAILLGCAPVFALNPAFDISQYAHTAWKSGEDGFPDGMIYAIAQTPDGYLWLGTESGPTRFDGIRTVPLQLPPNEHLPSKMVLRLLFAHDRTLWIGTTKGLASWKAGKLVQYPQLAGAEIWGLIEDRHGTVWAGGLTYSPPGKLCAFHDASIQCYGDDGSFETGVLGMYEDSKGNLWAGTRSGVWRWKPGRPEFYPVPGEGAGVQGIAEDENGALLMALRGRVARLVNGKPETVYRYPAALQQSYARTLMRDGDSLWIGTAALGLVHVHQGRVDVFAQSDRLSGGPGLALFKDHEGSIWVGTATGLDRFRDYAVVPYSANQGLPPPVQRSVVATRDGDMWVETTDGLAEWSHGAFRRFSGGNVSKYLPFSLFEDHTGRVWLAGFGGIGYLQRERFVETADISRGPVYSIVEDPTGRLWISSLYEGLLQLSGGQIIQKIPWADLGHKGQARAMAADSSGGLWLGYYQGGLAYFKNGRLHASYPSTSIAGLEDAAIRDLRLDREGTLWESTEGGISRLRDGHLTTLTSENGLPCDLVYWTAEDDTGYFWASTACGLVRMARSELEVWEQDPKRSIHATVFNRSDGVPSVAATGFGPYVAKSRDGRIWFTSMDGVCMIDPRQFPVNNVPPPVHIEQIEADGKKYDLRRGMGLPALTGRVRIDYTALSLVAPERVHFKYKLEGQDRDWREVVNDREAQYTNLPPRHYRFRVMASNNSGVWNTTGDTLEFSIKPAYYQTNWVRGLIVALVLGAAWGSYRLRFYQIAREFNVRLEERVSERTRMARELHDTLLQSFQGLMLRLQVVYDLLPPGKAKEQLEQSLERADQAIAEGRSALYDLRSSTTTRNDLAQALRAVGEELAAQHSTAFHLVVEGRTRDLHPIIRDEFFRIAREAIRNAFSHAEARHIETEITYGERAFRLRIRDDGQGVLPEILEAGRPGHYGLSGMRERARQIGAKLEIWSGAKAGTEIELSIAGSIAYSMSIGRHLFRFFRKKAG